MLLLSRIFFTLQNGVIFGPFFIMPFVIFSGFFLLYKDSPFFFKWLFHINFLKHGLVGVVISIFGFERPKLPCSDIYCHYKIPKQFMVDHGMEQEQYGIAVICLMVIAVVVSVSTYIVLRIRLRTRWLKVLFLNKAGYYKEYQSQSHVGSINVKSIAHFHLISFGVVTPAAVEFESWDFLREFIVNG